MLRSLRLPLLLATSLALTGCGFHLRGSAALPAGMNHVHVKVAAGGDLQRKLVRAMEISGVTVEDHSGAGIAELNVPTSVFRTETLTVSGSARVTEYSVRYHVEFDVKDQGGDTIVGHQSIDMSRDFSYDALNTIGSTTQTEELQRSLVEDMVQSILFRLQAAAKHSVPPQPTADTVAPATPQPATAPVPQQ